MRGKTYEFKELSDAREVVEHQIPRFMLWFFYFLLATLVFALVWSYLGKREIVVQTQGMVQPERTQNVVPLVNSTVRSVYFEEGDFVNAGDLIVKLDGRSVEAELRLREDVWRSQLRALELEMRHLDSLETQTNLFDERLLEEISKHQAVEGLLRSLEHSETPDRDLRLAKANVSSTIEQQSQLISQLESEIENLHQQLEHYHIKAAHDGKLHFVSAVRPGSTVAAGQELMRVHSVGEDDRLTVEFFVLNQDIAQIRIGQRVRVEIPALPARTYGFAEAEVIHIESDSRFDQASGQSFFLVRARLDSNTLTSGEKEETIRIGMQVMGRMITREQRILFWAIEQLELWIFR